MTYYAEPHAFADHEVDLAVTIARQVGFSIERFTADLARQSAEQELRELEQRFRLMSEHAPVMIWMSQPDGSCLHLNQMLRAFWNVEEEAVAEFNWRSTMHPDDADEIVAAMTKALGEHRQVSLKGRFRNAAGEWRVLQTDARPRFSASGEFLGMIGVNVDITDRERSDAQKGAAFGRTEPPGQKHAGCGAGNRPSDAQAHRPRQGPGRFRWPAAALAAAHNLLTQANWESAPARAGCSGLLPPRARNHRKPAGHFGAAVFCCPRSKPSRSQWPCMNSSRMPSSTGHSQTRWDESTCSGRFQAIMNRG